MQNELSLTDIYLIQGLLKNSSYEDISGLIERPVELIKDYADRFSKDQNKVTKQNILDAKQKKKNLRLERSKKIKKEKEDNRFRDQAIKKRKAENVYKQSHRVKKVESVFKTRVEDLSTKICVRINHKTTVFVQPGTNIVEFKKKFLARMEKSKEILNPQKAYKEVKKFKSLN